MEYKIIIPGRYPGLNNYISALGCNPLKGARLKKDSQYLIQMIVRSSLRGIAIKEPVRIHYTYFEKDRKRDIDNVAGFFHKIFQDALVSMNLLKNDGWANISGFTDDFEISKENPRIEVVIEEVMENTKQQYQQK